MPHETNHERDKQKKTDDDEDDDDDDVSGDTRIRQWSGLLTSAEPSQSPTRPPATVSNCPKITRPIELNLSRQLTGNSQVSSNRKSPYSDLTPPQPTQSIRHWRITTPLLKL